MSGMQPELVAVATSIVAALAVALAVLQKFGVVPTRGNSTPPATPRAGHSIPPRRSEQIAILQGQAALADTWTRERAEAERRAQRCDRHQQLEDQDRVHAVELARIGQRLDTMDERLNNQHTVLAIVRDAVLRMEGRINGGPMRGGAAGPR